MVTYIKLVSSDKEAQNEDFDLLLCSDAWSAYVSWSAHVSFTELNRNLTKSFREIGFAMRYNSLRVEQGVEHLVSPLEGMPKNLKDMNLKELKALTSILTDLTQV